MCCSADAANKGFDKYLEDNPQLKYAAFLDINGDGTEEMIAAEQLTADWQTVTLCVRGRDGSITDYFFSSRYSPVAYDRMNHALIGDSGGTGAFAYCALTLRGEKPYLLLTGREYIYGNTAADERLFYFRKEGYAEKVPEGYLQIKEYINDEEISESEFENYAAYLSELKSLELKELENFGKSMGPAQENVMEYGVFEQDGNVENGPEPICWRVVREEDGKVLLVSKYVLDCRYYDGENAFSDWKKSSVRNWLNSDFYQGAFTDEEKERIMTSTVSYNVGSDAAYFKGEKNGTAEDRIFLPDRTEYIQWCSEQKTYPVFSRYAEQRYDSGTGNNTPCNCWLRSIGEGSHYALYINVKTGEVSAMGQDVNVSQFGVCPAMWVQTD